MKKINEIFQSFQGEGCNTGIPSVFVRFSGCNLKCPFCDTLHQDGVMMSDEEIIEKIKEFNAEWIILTGGEPSFFIDEEFISNIKEATRKKVAIETNGSNIIPKNVDWVTVSPKSGFQGVENYIMNVDRADELKVVDLGQSLEEYYDYPFIDENTRFSLQPCYVSDEKQFQENIKMTMRRVLENPKWRLSLQTHRMLGIR